MTQYDNTNSGILAKNIDCDESRNQPQYRGSINVEGVDYWISAWIKDGREGTKLEGQKYFSMKLEPKQQAQVKQPAPKPQAAVESDIPF